MIGLLDIVLWLAIAFFIWRGWTSNQRVAQQQAVVSAILTTKQLTPAELGIPPHVLKKPVGVLKSLLLFTGLYVGIGTFTSGNTRLILDTALLGFIMVGVLRDGAKNDHFAMELSYLASHLIRDPKAVRDWFLGDINVLEIRSGQTSVASEDQESKAEHLEGAERLTQKARETTIEPDDEEDTDAEQEPDTVPPPTPSAFPSAQIPANSWRGMPQNQRPHRKGFPRP